MTRDAGALPLVPGALPLVPEAASRRALLEEALDALETLEARRVRTGNHVAATAELLERASAAPPSTGGDARAVLDAFVEMASAGWDKSSGSNLSFIPNGALDAGVAGALLAAGSHAFTGAAFEAPAMVAMEEGILRWIAELLGLPDGAGGILLSGGSLANQTAIVTARAAREGPGTPVLYASERVHHSVTKAALLAGLPPASLRLVPAGADGRCDTSALERVIAADVEAGHRPFMVVGVAGATDTGSIDPLAELADIAEAAGAWFHVDAAYAGFFALTDRGRRRLDGIGRADSVTIDAHKGLFVPYGVGALVVREPGRLVEAHEGRGAYLRSIETVADLPHYFLRGPELTRPSRAPLVWFPLQVHGTAAFTAALDRMLDLAELAHERLRTMPGIVVGHPPETSIVTFRAAAGDAATDALVQAIHATGRFQVSTTALGGRVHIRLAFLSPRTTTAHVEEVLGIVEAALAGAGRA